jgi:hypothetical protein
MNTIGNFTTTEGRQCTEMLDGEWVSLNMTEEAYQILSELLEENELKEEDRWFDIEESESGKLYATTGTSDLEYYIEVKF